MWGVEVCEDSSGFGSGGLKSLGILKIMKALMILNILENLKFEGSIGFVFGFLNTLKNLKILNVVVILKVVAYSRGVCFEDLEYYVGG
jgi:hypothetical protein